MLLSLPSVASSAGKAVSVVNVRVKILMTLLSPKPLLLLRSHASTCLEHKVRFTMHHSRDISLRPRTSHGEIRVSLLYHRSPSYSVFAGAINVALRIEELDSMQISKSDQLVYKLQYSIKFPLLKFVRRFVSDLRLSEFLLPI